MTKYQLAQLKRAIKRDLTKKHNYTKTVYNFPKETEKNLPEYIANNPWY